MNKIIGILIALTLFSCGKKSSQKEDLKNEKLTVITVNYPLFYFAEKIGGNTIDLQYIIPADVDPAFWNPNESALEIYQSADIILTNGANYAKWMENVSLPSSRLMNTSSSFENQLISLKSIPSHNHGPDGEHKHNGYAITTWLNFKLALKQAESVRTILVNKIPNEKTALDENFNELKKDLEDLDEKMTLAASNLSELNLIGSHPVYQYLSKGYKLNIRSVHFEPNEVPTFEQWEQLTKLLDASKNNLMLWEDSPNSETVKKLTELNIELRVFNPCANKPVDGDFLSIMNNNINNLKR